MRKLMRSIARANMEARGITGYNRKRRYKQKGRVWVSSFFAEHWREYVTKKMKKARAARIRKEAHG